MILHAARSIVFAASILATSVAAQPAAAPHLKAKVTLKAEAILPEQGFSGVTGAALHPDGVIVVLYAGGRSIHRFDSTGKYLGSVGREGVGRGEFIFLYFKGY